MRASGKWELYEPFPEVKDIHGFFVIVKEVGILVSSASKIKTEL